MPIEKIIDLFKFSEVNKISTVVISGGEASLHPEFDSLAEFFLRYNGKVRTVLQTNGAIAKKDLDLFKGFQAIHISFEPDGSNVRTSHTGELIKLALDLKGKGIYVYFFSTIHKTNIEKIDWMVEKANRFDIDIGFNICVPSYVDSKLKLSALEVKNVTNKLHALFCQRKILRFTSPLVAILEKRETSGYTGNRGGCTAGIATCVITPNGDVIPCPFLRVIAGNVYDENFPYIWFNSPVFNQLRDRSRFDQPCGLCKFISYCGGCRKNALDFSGKLTGYDPECFLQF